MKKHVMNCSRRVDGQFQVIVADTCGGKNQRVVVSTRSVPVGSDVVVRDGKVVHP